MNDSQHDEIIPPWYKQFWPWFIVGILVFAVVIGLGLLFIALANQDSMVRDNYYTEGRAINMHLGRDQMATQLALSSEFTVDELTGEISLSIDGQLEPLPTDLQLDLISPSHAERDRTVLLKRISGNQYAGQLPEPMQGRHYVDLSDPVKPGDTGWRLTDEITLSAGQTYRLNAK
tara:strand:- start:5788 stop:6312 length:525 start_codon:yes stop_codon:yes gene_type:complete